MRITHLLSLLSFSITGVLYCSESQAILEEIAQRKAFSASLPESFIAVQCTIEHRRQELAQAQQSVTFHKELLDAAQQTLAILHSESEHNKKELARLEEIFAKSNAEATHQNMLPPQELQQQE